MVGTGQENHALDFKLLKTEDFSSREDKETLARSLSGFANAEGGVVIWGVDARKNPRSGVDEVVAAPGIRHARLTLSRLLELTPSLASPAPVGVNHIHLKSRQGAGFVATYVPAVGPAMALAGLGQYFTRSSGSFMKMEHTQVADMFARRSTARIEPMARVSTDSGVPSLLLGMRNVGLVGATAPFILFRIHPPYGRFDGGVDGARRQVIPYEGRDPDGWQMHLADATFVVHPAVDVWVATAFAGYGPLAERKGKPCRIDFRLGVLGVPAISGSCKADFETGAVDITINSPS